MQMLISYLFNFSHMLLRQALLREELSRYQHEYDKVFLSIQLLSETEKRAMRAVLDQLALNITSTRNELTRLNDIAEGRTYSQPR